MSYRLIKALDDQIDIDLNKLINWKAQIVI